MIRFAVAVGPGVFFFFFFFFFFSSLLGSTFNYASNDIADGTKTRSCRMSGRKDTAGSLIYPSNACYEDDHKEEERIVRAAGRKDTAGSLLYPSEEEEQVRDPRRRIYSGKEVGETVGRNYDWSRTDKKQAFGLPTPHDNSGLQVRDAMNWGQK